MQKDCSTKIQQSQEVETNLSLQSNKSDKGLVNSLKAWKNTIIDLKLPQDGDTVLLPRRIHLRHHDDNQAATCGHHGAGIHGNHHPRLKSDFFFNCASDVFSLAGNLISWQSTGCVMSHLLLPCVLQVDHLQTVRLVTFVGGSEHEKHGSCLCIRDGRGNAASPEPVLGQDTSTRTIHTIL